MLLLLLLLLPVGSIGDDISVVAASRLVLP
jgi:hypothetical protein